MGIGMKRTAIPVKGRYENVAYSRAVRAGNLVEVAGTTALQPDGSVAHVGDMYRQSLQVCQAIESALQALGLVAGDVIRTRAFVTDISQWEAVGRAHAQVFGAAPPACSFLEVQRLVHPDMLVEIEATAVAGSAPDAE